MKIPSKLPQFLVKKSLLVVTSRQKAVFYFAYAGDITSIDSIEIPKPHYFDREGFFIGRNNNLTFRSGAVYELKDQMIKKELFPVFKDALQKLKNLGFQQIFLFSPNHMITEIKNIIPSFCRDKIAMTFKGNFILFHPIRLLKKIDERLDRKVAKKRNRLASLEEKKILSKAEQACKSYKCNVS